MQFDELPIDIDYEIGTRLTTRALIARASSSKKYWTLFQPLLNERKLLHMVTRGKHKEVEVLLKNDPSLMYKRGKIIDCSGRSFEHISAFEYTLWALDEHMWTLLLECIPDNEARQRTYAQLYVQYNKVVTKGVLYTVNEQYVCEKHFDFEKTIIAALQNHVNLINENPSNIDVQLIAGIGGAQKNLPAHVVQAYCSKESFLSSPNFTTRSSSTLFTLWKTKRPVNWFQPNSKLGIDFAVVKGTSSPQGIDKGGLNYVSRDLAAMKRLFEIRTEGLLKLKEHLEVQKRLINHLYP